MKTFMKILLPLALTVALLFGAVWYFTIYDPEFTQDMLLSCASYFEKGGNHTVASWFYDKAYVHGTNVEKTALELAAYYRSVGNYTKVEEALNRAINEGGGVDVYIALCRAFVEQDKILDALQLLNSVTDPALRAELDAKRPSAPTTGIPAGHYNDYVSVDFNGGNHAVYVTTADYPSIKTDLYTDPITLAAGETRFYALAVGDNGLVSPVQEFVFTVVGVIEEVVFTDSAMETAIRKLVNIPTGVTVYTNDLWGVQSFTLPTEASDYSDLKYLPFLTELTLTDSSLSLTPLSYLTELQTLHITNGILDSDSLATVLSMSGLKKLTLRNCGLTSLSGFEALTNLTYLDVGGNVVRNLTPLAQLVQLQTLHLDNNAVVDLSVLTALPALSELDAGYNSIRDLTPLGDMPALRILKLNFNLLTNVKTLGSLPDLEVLDLSYNNLVDVSPISQCLNLKDLNISNNAVKNILSFSALVKLETFVFDNNEVSVLPTWPKECALVTISGSYNDLYSLLPLVGLSQLNNIYADYNKNVSNVSSLSRCPKLVLLSVYGTKVKNLGTLIQDGVVVYADLT